jgi:NADH-quinone oxidoreductase subunit J
MIIQAIAFYLIAAITLLAALAVVVARNPVHSVLFLITVFFSAAGLFVMLGAEFLAMLLIVVYVGAVAVLFLFVVMMLDVDFAALRSGFAQYLPLGAAVALILAGEMVMVAITVSNKGAAAGAQPVIADTNNIERIGQVLYTDYAYFFQAAGLVLLVAMIGAIILTLRHKTNVKRQVIYDQVQRTPETGMEVVQIKPGAGIEL